MDVVCLSESANPNAYNHRTIRMKKNRTLLPGVVFEFDVWKTVLSDQTNGSVKSALVYKTNHSQRPTFMLPVLRPSMQSTGHQRLP
eukprot:1271810-Amphidinium_carterae.1